MEPIAPAVRGVGARALRPAGSAGLGILSEAALYLVTGVIAFLVFNRVTLANGLDPIPGDVGDVRFVVGILEHWLDVFGGKTSWLSPRFYHPVEGTLGYSEVFFLFALPYAPLRWLGLDPFTAYLGVCFLTGPIGYAGALVFLRGQLGLHPVAAAAAAAAFAFSNGLFLATNHPQLLFVDLVPWLAVLLLGYVRRMAQPSPARLRFGIGFLALLAAVAYSSFYTAWYFGFAVMLGLIAAVPWLLAGGGARRAWGWVVRERAHVLTLLACAVLFMVPFAVTYLPVRAMFGGRGYGDTVSMLPTVRDFLNIGYENLLWGRRIMRWFPAFDLRPAYGELRMGLTPALLLVFLAGGALMAWRATFGRRWSGAAPARAETDMIALVAGGAVILAWLLMVKIGGVSAWKLVHAVVPGSGAIRAVFRMNLVLAFPAAVVAAILLSRLLRGAAALPPWLGRPLWVGVAALSGLLVVEQFNNHIPTFSRQSQLAKLAVPPPPAECRSFFLTVAPGRAAESWELQIDAQHIAEATDLPTLNGYSGWAPFGWGLGDPRAPGYRDAVRSWIERHGLTGVCELTVGPGGGWRAG